MEHLRHFFRVGLLLAVIALAGGLLMTAGDRKPLPNVQPRTAKTLDNVTEVHGQPVTTVRQAGQKPAKAIAGEVVVKVADKSALTQLGNIHSAGGRDLYIVTFARSADLAKETARLAAIPGVAAAEPNYVVQATVTPNDTYFGSQWGLAKIAAPQGWDKTTGAASTVVASIDTGVDYNHQDMSSKMWTNSGDIPGNGIDDDNNGYVDDSNGMDFVNANFTNGKYVNDGNGPLDDNGHGTLTSSVMAAATNNAAGVAGLNWAAKVMPIKVLDASGFGSFVDVANGIRYATTNGAKVINMSLGASGVTSDFNTDQAISDAVTAGVTVVAASGNDGNINGVDYPAINSNVIAVGATNSDDSVAGYSNGGPQLSVTAPGTGILAAWGLNDTGYATASGTSLATPHVAGLASLLSSLRPQTTPAEMRQIIQNTADKPAGMGGQVRNNDYGYGRINANRAIAAIPAYSAQYVRQSSAPAVAAGEQTTVYVDYRNSGYQSWSSTGANPVRLGTSHPKDRQSGFYSSSWTGLNRTGSFIGRVENDNSVTSTTTIAPGETARFQFTITGYPAAGTFREYFQPVAEGVTWMEDYGFYFDMTVTTQNYAYSWAGQVDPPVSMQSGNTANVSFDLTNTGNTYWRRDGLFPLHVGTSRPRDRQSRFASGWPSANRLPNFAGKVVSGNVVDSDSIAPGETARFSFAMQAPSQPADYKEYFQPVLEKRKWLSDIGMYMQTLVPNPTGPAYDYQYVSQSANPVMTHDGSATVKLRIRNIGNTNWNSSGMTSVRLGTSHPKDRASGFSGGGTANGWLSTSRVHLTRNITDPSKDVAGETTIAPGETGEFEFTVIGSPPPGTYPEYFQPLVEGVTWMKDIGIYWNMTVQEPIKVGLAQQSTASFTSTGTVTLVTESGQNLGTVAAGQSFSLTYNGSYVVNKPSGTVTVASPIHAQQTVGAVMTVANLADNGSYNRFRGDLYVKNGTPGTWLVNEVDLEDYLKGGGEVPDSWPLEAVKAQAVAARTYAARKMQSPRNEVFDLYDTTSDQVYNGYNAELAKPNTATAVNQTKGVAVYYNGQLAQTYYSSDSGGATANNEDVWGGSPIPYLRAVSDPYQKPDIWSKTVSNATLQANYGHSGNIDTINILDYYWGGRVKTIRLITNGGSTTTYTYPADTQRAKMTTRSALITGLGRSGNDWVFSGRGFGHGIGMGQWGAYNQANAGRSYAQILQFYYTGITLGSLY